MATSIDYTRVFEQLQQQRQFADQTLAYLNSVLMEPAQYNPESPKETWRYVCQWLFQHNGPEHGTLVYGLLSEMPIRGGTPEAWSELFHFLHHAILDDGEVSFCRIELGSEVQYRIFPTWDTSLDNYGSATFIEYIRKWIESRNHLGQLNGAIKTFVRTREWAKKYRTLDGLPGLKVPSESFPDQQALQEGNLKYDLHHEWVAANVSLQLLSEQDVRIVSYENYAQFFEDVLTQAKYEQESREAFEARRAQAIAEAMNPQN